VAPGAERERGAAKEREKKVEWEFISGPTSHAKGGGEEKAEVNPGGEVSPVLSQKKF